MTPEPAPIPRYELAPDVAQNIADVKSRGAASVKAAAAITVTDDGAERLAVNARYALKDCEKDGEELRVGLVKPHNDFVESINAEFRALKSLLKAGVEYIDRQLLTYRREKQRRVDEENRRREQEAERLRQEAADQAASEAAAAGNFTPDETEAYAADAAAAVPGPEKIAEPPKVVRTDFAGAGEYSYLDFEVTDVAALAAALPEAISVNARPIIKHFRKQEKAGVEPQLAGVRYFRREAIRQR